MDTEFTEKESCKPSITWSTESDQLDTSRVQKTPITERIQESDSQHITMYIIYNI